MSVHVCSLISSTPATENSKNPRIDATVAKPSLSERDTYQFHRDRFTHGWLVGISKPTVSHSPVKAQIQP